MNLKKAFGYGFLTWLLPFVISVAIFPLKKPLPQFFDSILAVVVAAVGVLFACLYFRAGIAHPVQEGFKLGLLWLVISLAVDLPMFSYGPMKMSLPDYLANIGCGYLVFPIVALGTGIAYNHGRQQAENSMRAAVGR